MSESNSSSTTESDAALVNEVFGLAEVEERDIEIAELKVVAIAPEIVRDSAISWMPAPTRSVLYPTADSESLIPGQVVMKTKILESDSKGRIKKSVDQLEGILCPVADAVLSFGKTDNRVLVGLTAILCKCNNCCSSEYSGGTYWVDIEYWNNVIIGRKRPARL